jgi:uncharacterized membrane protein YcaP (DUF421 family)
MSNSLVAEIFSYPSYREMLIIAGKTAVIYLFLVIGLRLLGKRELGQMNIYDLVLIIVLANAVQDSMLGDDTTMFGGIVAATTLLALNRLFTLLMTRTPGLEHYLVGGPLILIDDGNILWERMKKEGITEEQLMAALREHGFERLEEVRMAILEVDGTISILPRQTEIHRTRRHYRALRLP